MLGVDRNGFVLWAKRHPTSNKKTDTAATHYRLTQAEQVGEKGEEREGRGGVWGFQSLVLIHLLILISPGLKVLIIILLLVGGDVLGSLGPVDDLASSAAAALDNVVQVNLVEVVLGLLIAGSWKTREEFWLVKFCPLSEIQPSWLCLCLLTIAALSLEIELKG